MEENLCRICLQTNNEEEMKSIFDKDENTIISNKIKSCCGIKIIKNADGFPTKICSKCNVFLSIAYKLRTICQNSDAYLRRFVVKDFEVEETEEIPIKPEKDEIVSKYEDGDDKPDSEISFPEMAQVPDDINIDYDSNPELIKDTSNQKPESIKVTSNQKPRKKIIKKHNPENPIDKQSLTCLECGQTLYSKVNLLRHIERHKQGFLKPKKCKLTICPYCGDCFPQTSLGIHIRRHTGEKPYKCDMCEKAFVRTQDLKIHKRSHTGEKPHVCETCGKAFSRQNKLSRHIRVHTGERPYKCNQCDKGFAQRNDLNLHIRRHTGDKPYKCGVCEESFYNGTLLRNHQKSQSHFEEKHQDPFLKIRVTNPTRTHRNPVSRRINELNK